MRINKLNMISVAVFSFILTACENPTDVYVFELSSCQPNQPLINLKSAKCRVRLKESSAFACKKSFAEHEALSEFTNISYMMNNEPNEKCQIYAAITYPKQGISDKTKNAYYEVVSRALRSCLDHSTFVLKEEYRVDDADSYNSLCDRSKTAAK
ncbi:MAG: hypothetical protein H7328_03860 [Bdellovibrio sp.]|nr:hypothetical protein [Bdellovibrio sp.]